MSKFSQYDTVRLVKPNSYLIDQGFKTRVDYDIVRVHSQMGRLQLFGLFVRSFSLSNPVRLVDENGTLTGAGECFELLSVIEAKQNKKKSIEISQDETNDLLPLIDLSRYQQLLAVARAEDEINRRNIEILAQANVARNDLAELNGVNVSTIAEWADD